MTPTQRAVMKQALEALELNCASQTESPATKAMQALRAALAEQPAEQMPIAMKTHGAWDGLELLDGLPDGACLYTTPQPTKLEDQQPMNILKKLLDALYQESNAKQNFNEWLRASPALAQRAAQAEAEWVVAVKHSVAAHMEAEKYVAEYTAPQPRRDVELTDEEIYRALDAANVPELPAGYKSVELEIARAVIAAYKAKQGEQT